MPGSPARLGIGSPRCLAFAARPKRQRICLPARATSLDGHGQQTARACPPGPPIGALASRWDGTINPLSISYAPLPGASP